MTVERYNSARRRDAQPKGRLADDERRERILQNGLTHLSRMIVAAKTGRIVNPGTDPVTHEDARTAYFDMLGMLYKERVLPSQERLLRVQGVLQQFSEQQRPLLFRNLEDSVMLQDRYGFDPTSYGRDAISILSAIAGGDLRGGAGQQEETTPVGAVVRILRDTFDHDTARDTVVSAIEARQEHLSRSLESIDLHREAIVDAVGELSSFSGERVVQALAGVMQFAGERDDSMLLAASANSLRQFVENPKNREAVENQMNALRILFQGLPDGEIGKRLLAEVFQTFAGQPVRKVR